MLRKIKNNYFLLISTFLIIYFFFNLLDGERGLFSYFEKKKILVNLQNKKVKLTLKGANLGLTANSYHKISNMETYKSTEEQVLSGYTINLASQIPYAPWAKINLQNYSWENEKASSDTEGNSIALEAFLTPSVQIEFKNDMSDNSGVDDEFTSKLTYTYPPREDGKSMQDGFSNVAFEKENVQNKLKDKVNRNNNLTVEVQGSIIVTSK